MDTVLISKENKPKQHKRTAVLATCQSSAEVTSYSKMLQLSQILHQSSASIIQGFFWSNTDITLAK